jgi:delta-aminolevulinic acid dehydratase/porphobilinogen synthase
MVPVHKQKSVASAADRAQFVSKRLREISSSMAQDFIECGILLREYKENSYFKEEGYESFDEAINDKYTKGEIEFQSRNARNAIAVADMLAANGMKPEDVKKIAPSKLREIASLPPNEQKKMLPKAEEMTVGEIQEKAKAIRHKAKGLDVDPYDPIILRDATATAKTAFNANIAMARRVYNIPEEVPDFVVLVDHIMAEWASGQNDIVSGDDDVIDLEAEIDARV